MPDTALGTDQTGRYLLVVDKDDVVQQRTVTTGARVGPLRVIATGSAAGRPRGDLRTATRRAGAEGRAASRRRSPRARVHASGKS